MRPRPSTRSRRRARIRARIARARALLFALVLLAIAPAPAVAPAAKSLPADLATLEPSGPIGALPTIGSSGGHSRLRPHEVAD